MNKDTTQCDVASIFKDSPIDSIQTKGLLCSVKSHLAAIFHWSGTSLRMNHNMILQTRLDVMTSLQTHGRPLLTYVVT
jgi:hypothetical protein